MPSCIKCVDKECPTNSMPPKQRRLFCFPRGENLRRQWLEIMDRLDLLELNHQQLCGRGYRVCELHFEDRQFQNAAKLKLCGKQLPRRVRGSENIPSNPSNSSFDTPLNTASNNHLNINISTSITPNNPSTSSFDTPLNTPSNNVPNININISSISTPNPINTPSNILTNNPTSSPNIPSNTPPNIPDSPMCSPNSPLNSPSNIFTNSPISSEFHTNSISSPSTSKDCTIQKNIEDKRRRKPFAKKQDLHTRLKTAVNALRGGTKRTQFLSQSRNANVPTRSTSNIIRKNKYSLPRTLALFVLALLRSFHQTKKNRAYSLEDKALFLSVLKYNPRCYRYLQKILNFPSTRTLKRSLPNLHINSGINNNLLNYLKNISNKMPLNERFCTLMFHKMEVGENISLMTTGNSLHVEGFVKVGTETDQKLADHILVFMIRGLAKKWKQPVAFFFAHKAANHYILKSLIKQVVQAVHGQTDFRIIASVCDSESWNVAAVRHLSEECGKEGDQFVYNIDGHEIIHLFDVPHLLKSVRNDFMTNDVVYEGKIAKWSDIRWLNELDADSGALKASKLTNDHVNPSNIQKMNVKLAAQVFSRSTASLLHILSKAGAIDALGTAEFVLFMNDLFDSLNSVFTSTKPLARKLTNTSHHFAFWKGASRKLSQLVFLSDGKRVENPPTIKLLLSTIGNVRCLWNSLRGKGFKYLTLRSLNLDPLENLFSVTRGLCGANPSATQFVDAYKTVIFNNTARCGIGANCEDDGENFLLSYEILLSDSNPSEPIEPIPSTSFSPAP